MQHEAKKVSPKMPKGSNTEQLCSYCHNDDEINLIDIWNVLVSQKTIILGVVVFATLCSFLYAVVTPSVYKVTTSLVPPTESDIQSLNIEGVNSTTPEKVFQEFTTKLLTIPPRLKIFQKISQHERNHKDIKSGSSEDYFYKLAESITVSAPRKKKGEAINSREVRVSMENSDDTFGIEAINALVVEVKQQSIEEIITNIKSKITSEIHRLDQDIKLLGKKAKKQRMDEIKRLKASNTLNIKELNDKIESLRKKAQKDRMDEILRLEEADRIKKNKIVKEIKALKDSANKKKLNRIAVLKEATDIARKLKIKDPLDYNLGKITNADLNRTQVITNLSSSAKQLYQLGYEALDAEIVSLSNRKNNNLFIPELIKFENHLKLLEHNAKITALKNRVSDDPFIPNIRDLQKELYLLQHDRRIEELESRKDDTPYIKSLVAKKIQLDRLRSIQIDPSTIVIARLNQAPYAEKIKPKRKLIIGLGVMLGLMLGVFMAFIVNFIKSARDSEGVENSTTITSS